MLVKTCCAECGRPLQKPKPVAGPVDTAVLTDTQLYAHYKKTALVGDLRFLLRLTLSPELRARGEAITKPTKVDLSSMAQAWREERAMADRWAEWTDLQLESIAS